MRRIIRRCVVSALQRLAAVFILTVCCAPQLLAAQAWGGSVGVTSDYLLRGISRSDHDAALQADVHAASDVGFIGGLSASTVRFSADDHREVELSAFGGFAWDLRGAWHPRVLVSHYAYPLSKFDSHYDYDEIAVEASFEEWLDVSAAYSPNWPRYVPYVGLIGVRELSAEANVRSPPWHRWSAAAGIGYSDLAGPDGAGYTYWSAGAVYEFAPWTLALAVAGTSAAATDLYYNAAAHNRFTATLIWRF